MAFDPKLLYLSMMGAVYELLRGHDFYPNPGWARQGSKFVFYPNMLENFSIMNEYIFRGPRGRYGIFVTSLIIRGKKRK